MPDMISVPFENIEQCVAVLPCDKMQHDLKYFAPDLYLYLMYSSFFDKGGMHYAAEHTEPTPTETQGEEERG